MMPTDWILAASSDKDSSSKVLRGCFGSGWIASTLTSRIPLPVSCPLIRALMSSSEERSSVIGDSSHFFDDVREHGLHLLTCFASRCFADCPNRFLGTRRLAGGGSLRDHLAHDQIGIALE